jgi:hypothetical protein
MVGRVCAGHALTQCKLCHELTGSSHDTAGLVRPLSSPSCQPTCIITGRTGRATQHRLEICTSGCCCLRSCWAGLGWRYDTRAQRAPHAVCVGLVAPGRRVGQGVVGSRNCARNAPSGCCPGAWRTAWRDVQRTAYQQSRSEGLPCSKRLTNAIAVLSSRSQRRVRPQLSLLPRMAPPRRERLRMAPTSEARPSFVLCITLYRGFGCRVVCLAKSTRKRGKGPHRLSGRLGDERVTVKSHSLIPFERF